MGYLYIPAALEAAARDEALRRQEFTTRDILLAAEMSSDQVKSLMRRWSDTGEIVFVRKIERGHNLYRLGEGFQPAPLLQGRTAEDNMWIAMRLLRAFSATDVSAHATTHAIPVSPLVARKYIQALEIADYLRPVRKAGGKQEARWLIKKNTGPRAPEVRRISVVEDMNTGEVTHIERAAK